MERFDWSTFFPVSPPNDGSNSSGSSVYVCRGRRGGMDDVWDPLGVNFPFEKLAERRGMETVIWGGF